MVILLYHRVADLATDPWALAVSPPRFESQLAMLKRELALLTLADLTDRLRGGALPPRAAVLTFDDGYADSLETAAPILGRHGVPATVFVTTSPRRISDGFWWDELDAILLTPGTLPAALDLTIEGSPERWALGAASRYGADEAAEHRRWRVGQPPVTSRHAIYVDLWRRLKPLPDLERRRLLDAIAEWAGRPPGVDAEHRLLDPDEVRALADRPGMAIGAHTETHPCLATLLPAEQRGEIESSKRALEVLLGRPVTSFAYPFGGPGDHTDDTVALVRATGLACACLSVAGAVAPGSDLYRLPRLYVRDWGAPRLAAAIGEQLEAGVAT